MAIKINQTVGRDDVNAELYKDYIITVIDGIEKGIFFRSPIQSVHFDAIGWGDELFNAQSYQRAIKNPLRRAYEFIIGNGKILENIEEWAKDDRWGGFYGNILCFPIYFKRKYCKLEAKALDGGDIKKVVSYGYESEFNVCAGNCHKETTTITLKNGEQVKIKRKGVYKFTYLHVIKDIIDTGKI